MPGLLDVVASQKTVTLSGVEVPVPGISGRGIAYLLGRFEILRKVFSGKDSDLTLNDALDAAPDLLAALLAAGVGHPGDEAYEAKAESLTAQDQLILLEAVLAVTMPNGPVPFVEHVTALVGRMGGEDLKRAVKSGNIQDTKSPTQSSESRVPASVRGVKHKT